MVGTNWGAHQTDRARRIAWTGAGTIAVVCGLLGLVVAIWPGLWLTLFSNSAEVERIGSLYLHIVGPVYVCFGLGFGLFFVSQGFGRGFAAMSANAARLTVTGGAGLAAMYGFGLGIGSLFAAVSAGFALYAALLVYAVTRVKPDAPAAAEAK
jgi:Na+-driven multidrug efflux pump